MLALSRNKLARVRLLANRSVYSLTLSEELTVPLRRFSGQGQIWQTTDQKSERHHLHIRGLVQRIGFAIFLEERRPQGEPEGFSSKL